MNLKLFACKTASFEENKDKVCDSPGALRLANQTPGAVTWWRDLRINGAAENKGKISTGNWQ